MSVGGIVVDIVPVTADKWWINTVQNYDWTLLLTPEQIGKRAVAVYCDPLGEPIEVGDSLWWQAGKCYWTPRVHPDGRSDVPLRKIGGSGVAHPHLPRCEVCGCTLAFCRKHGVCRDEEAPSQRGQLASPQTQKET